MENKKKIITMFLAAVIAGTGCAGLGGDRKTALAEKLLFADAENEWFTEAVSFARTWALIDGYEDDLFHPYDPVTAAQLSAMLYRVNSNFRNDEATLSSDETEKYWAAGYMHWARDRKLYEGFAPETDGAQSDAVFGDKKLTREEVISMMYRFFLSANESPETSQMATDRFHDFNSVSEFAADAVCWAAENGIIEGDDDLNINPKQDVTRAETAAILQRYILKFEYREEPEQPDGNDSEEEDPENSTDENSMTEYGTDVGAAEKAVGMSFPAIAFGDLNLTEYYTIQAQEPENAVMGADGTYKGKSVTIRMGRGDRDVSGIYGGTVLEDVPNAENVLYLEHEGILYAVWAVVNEDHTSTSYSVSIEGGSVEELIAFADAIGTEDLNEGAEADEE